MTSHSINVYAHWAHAQCFSIELFMTIHTQLSQRTIRIQCPPSYYRFTARKSSYWSLRVQLAPYSAYCVAWWSSGKSTFMNTIKICAYRGIGIPALKSRFRTRVVPYRPRRSSSVASRMACCCCCKSSSLAILRAVGIAKRFFSL